MANLFGGNKSGSEGDKGAEQTFGILPHPAVSSLSSSSSLSRVLGILGFWGAWILVLCYVCCVILLYLIPLCPSPSLPPFSYTHTKHIHT